MNNDVNAELPQPHDMQLAEPHQQLLRKPTFFEKYGWMKWFLPLLLGFFVVIAASLYFASQSVHYAKKTNYQEALNNNQQNIKNNTNQSKIVTTKPVVSLPNPTIASTSPSESTATPPKDLIEAVKNNLATYLNVDPDKITVTSAASVEWNNASLGCPKPDMMYAEVIVPGYSIALQYNQTEYHYHTDTSKKFILCNK